MNINKYIVILLAVVVIQFQTGCAAYRTISDADAETAKVLSGTRLDIKAIQGDMLPTKLFKSKPPSSPILDLPFSFALDILLLPLTTSAVVYYAIFQ